MIAKSVLPSTQRVIGLQKFGKSIIYKCKSSTKLVDVLRVGFVIRKLCRRLVTFRRVFYFRNVSRRIQKFGETILTSAKRVEGLQKFRESLFTNAKCEGIVQMFGESVLTTAKCVGGLWKFGEFVLNYVKCIGGLQKFGEAVLTFPKGLNTFTHVTRNVPQNTRPFRFSGVSGDETTPQLVLGEM